MYSQIDVREATIAEKQAGCPLPGQIASLILDEYQSPSHSMGKKAGRQPEVQMWFSRTLVRAKKDTGKWQI